MCQPFVFMFGALNMFETHVKNSLIRHDEMFFKHE